MAAYSKMQRRKAQEAKKAREAQKGDALRVMRDQKAARTGTPREIAGEWCRDEPNRFWRCNVRTCKNGGSRINRAQARCPHRGCSGVRPPDQVYRSSLRRDHWDSN